MTLFVRRTAYFIDATAMCKATDKQWDDYWREAETQDFLAALSSETGAPISELVQVRDEEGDPHQQTIWVHSRVARHLGAWCSPDFGVWVSSRLDALGDYESQRN
jgi:hypothetical protein